MSFWRKRPVVVKAEQFLDGYTVEGMCAFIDCPVLPPHAHTANGVSPVQDGDWVLVDEASGDCWPVKPDIFAATYECAAPAIDG